MDPAHTLKKLDETPAWRDGALKALEEHRPVLQHISDTPIDTRWPLALRMAELLAASLAPALAIDVVRGLPVRALDSERAQRLAFLRARLARHHPEAGLDPSFEDEDTDLDGLRLLALAWANALAARDVPALVSTLEAARRAPGEGLRCDEIRFDALVTLAGLHTDPRTRAPILDEAAQVARRNGAPWDEASLLLGQYMARMQMGDREALLALARRAADLPRDVPGALPPGLLAQLEGVALLAEGDAEGAIRRFDQGIVEADGRGDASAYAALVLAKARVFSAADRSWGAYRTLKLGMAWLKKRGTPFDVEALRAEEHAVKSRTDPAAWAEFASRLKKEILEAR